MNLLEFFRIFELCEAKHYLSFLNEFQIEIELSPVHNAELRSYSFRSLPVHM